MATDPSDLNTSARTNNPFADQPATSQVDTGGNSAQPNPAFVALVGAKIRQMIGAQGKYVSEAAITKIVGDLWENTAMQAAWANYEAAPATYAASLLASVQATILNPGGDPTINPNIINDYIGAKQSVGESLSAAELAALTNADAAAGATVPRPFNENVVSGYDFGAAVPPEGWSPKSPGNSYGWDKHYGVDYGTRAGERIVAPFAGTITVETGVQGYGNLVVLTLDNGWKISFGHVAQGFANGQRVNPGDLIALAGANIGSAVGSVTLVTVQNPRGRFVNPHDLLDPVFAGTTFGQLGFQAAAGTGMPSVNKVLDAEYPGIKQDWVNYFGTPPSPEDVYNVLAHGTTPQQWHDFILSMPSNIEGLNVGTAYGIRTTADNISQTLLGHGATDGIVKDLHDQGFTSQAAIKAWYDNQSPNQIDAAYHSVVKASKPVMTNIFNEPGFDPRDAKPVLDNATKGPR